MCCFSGSVRSVSETRIFARALPDGRQALVYAMSFEADADLAMVLPLPTPIGVAGELPIALRALHGVQPNDDQWA